MSDWKPVINGTPSVDRFTGTLITVKSASEYFLATLDMLALALNQHGHTWTAEERKAYEQATGFAKMMPQQLTSIPWD